MSKRIKNADEMTVRREVRNALTVHFNNRGDISVSKEAVSKLAAELSMQWSTERCKLFAALARESNRFWTKRQLARELVTSPKAVSALWLGLKQIVISVEGKEFVLFRPENVRFAHSQKNEIGGICLRLCGDEPLPYSEERRITESTRAATTALVVNYETASQRQEAIVPSGERAEIANDRAATLRGVSGEQLGLVLPKTGA